MLPEKKKLKFTEFTETIKYRGWNQYYASQIQHKISSILRRQLAIIEDAMHKVMAPMTYKSVPLS